MSLEHLYSLIVHTSLSSFQKACSQTHPVWCHYRVRKLVSNTSSQVIDTLFLFFCARLVSTIKQRILAAGSDHRAKCVELDQITLSGQKIWKHM